MNNIIRATVQALAAVLGGAQSMAISCYDEGRCIPTEDAVRQSLRLQQILAYESGTTDVVDPLGGSYYIESLTNKLEKEASEYVAKIDSLGGAAAAIEQGYQQREIQEASYRYQQEIESGKRVIVGINKFISPSPKITLSRVGPEVEINQKEKLIQLKKDRDNAKVSQALKHLEEVAQSKDNTMPAFLECAEAYATLGEMCDVLRKVFGTQKEFLAF
jgi:Methylmalonyl-CoA mutase, N-terminal domain/subunit